MENHRQVEDARELLRYVASGNGWGVLAEEPLVVDADIYRSHARFTQEREVMFSAYPLVACLSANVKSVGDYVARDMLGTPALIARGRDEKVRAFLNACRHRGAKVAEGCGSARSFTCPFHAWSYDLAGGLVAISQQASFGDIDRSANGLIELPCVEKYGIIWISLKAGADFEIDEHLHGMGEELAAWQLESLAPFSETEFEAKANWKLALDTYGETYHLETLHKATIGPMMHSNINTYQEFGPNHRISFAAQTIGSLAEVPESQWSLREHGVTGYYIYPNTSLTITPGNIMLINLFPTAVDRVLTRQGAYLTAKPANEIDRMVAQYFVDMATGLLIDEDYAVAQSIQEGLSNDAVKSFTFGRNELGAQHFHRTFSDVLASSG